MAIIRNILATLAFAIGFFGLGGGIFIALLGMGAEAANHQPVTLDVALPGIIAAAIGFVFLLISRALDGKNGPVKRYSSKSKGKGDYS